MSYLNYVIASYAIFVLVLGWEFLASRLQIRRELRNARRRAARRPPRHGNPPGTAGTSAVDKLPENPPPISNELTR